MATTKAKRHTHRYYKLRPQYENTGPNFLWACALPDCNHHMPKHMEQSLRGKYTLCWKCDETMILDERAWKMDKPLCENCDPNTLSVENLTEEQIAKLKEMGVLNKFD